MHLYRRETFFFVYADVIVATSLVYSYKLLYVWAKVKVKGASHFALQKIASYNINNVNSTCINFASPYLSLCAP